MKHLFNNFNFRSSVMIFAALLMLNSCMSGKRLDTRGAVPTDIQGAYTLILYGCRYPSDLENLAILYTDGGPLTFEMYTLKTAYRVKNGLPADEALKQAERFLTCSMDYWQTQLSKIVDRDGAIAGYELRPLYAPYKYGMMDVLDIHYWLRGSKVTVYIRLDPDIERALENAGGENFTTGK
jgi:hypothetical protein